MAPIFDGEGRRSFLRKTVGFIATFGVGFLSIPFIGSMLPSAKAKSRGGPVRVDVSSMEPGQRVSTTWRGKPVWLVRRSEEMIEDLNHPELESNLLDPQSNESKQQPYYARNQLRSVDPEYFVVIALCTHLGCIPSEKRKGELDQALIWKGGFFCPCHGSKFDYAGRVFKNVPAPANLVIPPHRYNGSSSIVIGEEGPSRA